jgi:soluble lytic murein transglycosylase-like protein
VLKILITLTLVTLETPCFGETPTTRVEAEYYVAQYANHYRVPLDLVRSIVQQESAWHACAVSPKGAVGLMQLMPATAMRLGVTDRCDIQQNISGGVRYLAWLIRLFRGDLRLATAAYYAGERVIARRGLDYRNPDVIAYVAQVRQLYRNRGVPAGKVQKDQNRRKPLK